MAEIVSVSIPTDGSIEPCAICGSITVDLDGKPQPCMMHRFCPPCGGTEEGFMGPQYCFLHSCSSWLTNRTHCRLERGHEGPHRRNPDEEWTDEMAMK